jgi:hypothetical protein
MCQVLYRELTGGGQPYGSENKVSLKGVNSITGVYLILKYGIMYITLKALSLECMYYTVFIMAVGVGYTVLVSH